MMISQGLVTYLFFAFLKDAMSECLFPEFLWHTQFGSDTQREWMTEIKYSGNSQAWVKQHITEVMKTEMMTRVKFPIECTDFISGDEGLPCFKEEMLYRRYCLHDVDGEKFAVRQGEPGNEKFTCMKFVQRGQSVVQVWIANLKDSLLEDICEDAYLKRVDWPWIGAVQKDWSPCPFTGGFDFNAYLNERKRRLCRRNWRPSRIESECATGDGIHFLFPEKKCSPFHKKLSENHFQCWTNWTEAEYSFIVLGERDSLPQYILRLPGNYEWMDEYTAMLYFSPVAPLNEQGIPENNAMHVRLEFSRSASGVCFDESEEACTEYAKDGKCLDKHHAIGNQCKKSCNLCKLAPSDTAECHFPLQYQGQWLLFEHDRREEVSIRGGELHFSISGFFICKGKHWDKERYKLLTVQDNGCRPRFTCIEFLYEENGTVLRYKLSSSNRTDESFDLCEFRDDLPPLGNRFRSADYKVLLPVSRTVLNTCGLGGLVYANAMVVDEQTEQVISCHVTLSDWKAFECMESSTLGLSFRQCGDYPPFEYEEYQCEAYVNMQDDYRLLITSQVGVGTTDVYACWIIRINSYSSTTQPWQDAYILKRAQCGAPEDFDPAIYKPLQTNFQLYSKNLEKDCIVMNKGSTVYASTIKYTLKKQPTSKTQRDNDRKQHTATARSSAGNTAFSPVHSDNRAGIILQVAVHILLTATYRYS